MTVRVFVEKFKIAQVDGREDWILGFNTGQILSIPFIIIGLYYMFLHKSNQLIFKNFIPRFKGIVEK